MEQSTVDVLMEIRRLNTKISEEKLKVQQSEQKLLSLEESLNDVKNLQLKALSMLKETEQKTDYTRSELKDIHKLYAELIEYVRERTETVPNSQNENEQNSINELRKRRDHLKDALAKAKAEKEEVAMKINNLDLQITIEKKKNAAMILRLQKTFEELLQEEKNLLDKSQ